MSKHDHDVVVVGAGPGGYVAAIRSAQLGLKTALVEREQLGGICLNWGCIPTKALLRSADVLRLLRNANRYGVDAGPVVPNFAAMVSRSRVVATQLNKGVAHLLKKNGVSVIRGHARLQGHGLLTVEGESGGVTLQAKHIVLATGARARTLPALPPPGREGIWTYREALAPSHAPKRLLIVGAGAIGIEFASFYSAIGTQVTVVEAAERILPSEDAEVSAHVATSLMQEGIALHVGTSVVSAARTENGWHIQLSAKLTNVIEADVVLLAVGITGNVEDIGLERTAARVVRNHVVVDAMCRTAEKGLFAIGDVAGPPWLAHKASHEGVIVAEHIAGLQPHALDLHRVPACTYSHPQVASVGLTEAQARDTGRRLKTGKFPFSANGKAIAMGTTNGFVKVVFDADTGELLGAHMVGDEVTEMIQGFAIAQHLETTERDVMETVLPHPTMSEAMHEAVLAAYGRALHI
jgi:dihydrolipoamide dehydrogenase